MDTTEATKTIAEKIHGIRTATLTTTDPKGNFVSRPLATQENDFDGTIWFMTSKNSEKVSQIQKDNRVNVTYTSGDHITFVSVSGTAECLRDETKIKEFWNDFYKAWFEGPEDPNITLIKVSATRAEYWDTHGGKIVALANIAKAALTGDQGAGEDDDENEVVNFS
jgi:general stress protein 26